MKALILMLFVAASLAACGGSDDMPAVSDAGNNGVGSGAGANNGGGIPQGSSDPFVSQVQSVIAATADNTPPVAVDTTAASAPDNTQPVPIS